MKAYRSPAITPGMVEDFTGYQKRLINDRPGYSILAITIFNKRHALPL
jgi:hypothetical protein